MTVNHHPKKDWTNQDNAILCHIMETLRPFNVSIYRQEHYSTHHYQKVPSKISKVNDISPLHL